MTQVVPDGNNTDINVSKEVASTIDIPSMAQNPKKVKIESIRRPNGVLDVSAIKKMSGHSRDPDYYLSLGRSPELVMRAAVSIQRYYRGYSVRSQRMLLVDYSDLMVVVQRRRQTLYGYFHLALYIAFVAVFANMLIEQRSVTSTHSTNTELATSIEKFDGLEGGWGVGCKTAVEASLDIMSKFCSVVPEDQYGTAIDVAAACIATRDDTKLPKINFKDIIDISQAQDWIETFVGTVLGNTVKDVDITGRDSSARYSSMNHIYGGMYILVDVAEFSDCNATAAAELRPLYPSCKATKGQKYQQPLSKGANTALWANNVPQLDEFCPPYKFSKNFDSHAVFVPNGYVFFGAELWALIVSLVFRGTQLLSQAATSAQVMSVMYNGHTNMFSVVRAKFDISETGIVSPSTEVTSFPWDETLFHNDALPMAFAVFAGILLLMKVRDIFNAVRRKHVQRYFSDIWNVIDIVNFSLYIYSIMFWSNFASDVSKHKIEAFSVWQGAPGNPAPPPSLLQSIAAELSSIVSSLEKFSNDLDTYFMTQGVSLILSLLRLFKYMRFQPRLALIERTLITASTDLLHFMLVFIVCLVMTAIVGTIAFGTQVAAFSTFRISVLTNFSWTLGDFAKDGLFENYPTAGPLYFTLFVVLVFLVLLNMFLAIVMDAYAIEKANVSLAARSLPTELGWITMHFVRLSVAWIVKVVKWQRWSADSIEVPWSYTLDVVYSFQCVTEVDGSVQPRSLLSAMQELRQRLPAHTVRSLVHDYRRQFRPMDSARKRMEQSLEQGEETIEELRETHDLIKDLHAKVDAMAKKAGVA